MGTVLDDNARTGLFKEFQMPDFTFQPSDFTATFIEVVANTPAGKEYLAKSYGGIPVVSINVRKSYAPSLAESFQFEGLTFE
jgi:hypothetical protein